MRLRRRRWTRRRRNPGSAHGQPLPGRRSQRELREMMMSSTAAPEPTGVGLPAATQTGTARAAALASYTPPQPAIEWVAYRSHGHLLIISPADEAWPLAKVLAGQLTCTVLAPRAPAEPPQSSPPASRVHGEVRNLRGYLGAFDLEIVIATGVVIDDKLAFGLGVAGDDLVL